jgi:hypothetical protein
MKRKHHLLAGAEAAANYTRCGSMIVSCPLILYFYLPTLWISAFHRRIDQYARTTISTAQAIIDSRAPHQDFEILPEQ